MSNIKHIFISQPMKGKTDKEITSERDAIIAKLKGMYSDDIVVIDSYITMTPPESAYTALWMLGKALQKMAAADVVVFAKGWENARGCRIEHEAAQAYDLEIVEI